MRACVSENSWKFSEVLSALGGFALNSNLGQGVVVQKLWERREWKGIIPAWVQGLGEIGEIMGMGVEVKVVK